MDFKNIGAKRVCVVTDGNVSKLDAMTQVAEGLSREGVEFTVYSKTRVEPKDSSWVFNIPHSNNRALLTKLQDQRGH